MASWIIHLRIADALLRRQECTALEPSHFLAGNIAPDCGKPVEGGGFDPDLHVTHFTKTKKGACEYMRFWEDFGREETDSARRSFYLGYFVHLMTDVLWVRWINDPTKEKYSELYRSDRTEYYRLVKGDWYGQDFLYLQKHPDFCAYRRFCELSDYENDWLPFYDRDNLQIQFRHIAAFYGDGGTRVQRTFSYLTEQEADAFVEKAAALILQTIADL